MPLYESTFIIRQDISSQDADKIADGFAAIIKDDGGKIIKKEYWGLRTLAYKINKAKKGHYVMFGFEASSSAIQEMERKLGLSEDVVRNLTVKVDNISKEPSAILAEDGDERKPRRAA